MRLIILFIMMISMTAAYGQEFDSTQTTEEAVAPYQDEEKEHEEITHASVDPATLENTHEYQTEKLSVRKFNTKKWKEIVGSTNYDEKQKEKPKNDKNFEPPSIPWNSEILRVVSYVLIVSIIFMLLYYLVKNISIDGFKVKKNTLQADKFTAPLEDIEHLDIEGLLQRAIREGNFKLAVRLYYLDLLKKLNENKIIVWKKDKTNRDYLTELFLKDYYFEEVKKLTLAYEQVWYGEHLLTPDTFQRLTINFETIHQNIANASKPL